ncbi:MAG: alpha/beta hydrolase [Rhodospirillales bacterium]|jgi:haloacetate dehalogenase|nr:alpha/beta hydrolase [Rhodospirillales bacterium]HJO71710.1 alpha/beta hydrolase [Rhodospirillales bacterium]
MFEGFTAADIETDGAVIHTVHGGSGPPLLLLHGYPQTHVMWHKIAPRLAERFTVVVPDLRGYGDSAKPPGDDTHTAYSKRAMAKDQVDVMAALGFESFFVAGHDRGGRVSHRMVLDHPGRVRKLSVLDIVPTHRVFSTIDQTVATSYYHWFFLIQPFDLPETLIGSNPEYYLRKKLGSWGADVDSFSAEAMAEYVRCFTNPDTIHATCEDYRAAASIDLEHDEADMETKISCPVLVLWGAKGLMERRFDVLATWRERAADVAGRALLCGHFLPEEAPEETYAELARFFG